MIWVIFNVRKLECWCRQVMRKFEDILLFSTDLRILWTDRYSDKNAITSGTALCNNIIQQKYAFDSSRPTDKFTKMVAVTCCILRIIRTWSRTRKPPLVDEGHVTQARKIQKKPTKTMSWCILKTQFFPSDERWPQLTEIRHPSV